MRDERIDYVYWPQQVYFSRTVQGYVILATLYWMSFHSENRGSMSPRSGLLASWREGEVEHFERGLCLADVVIVHE